MNQTATTLKVRLGEYDVGGTTEGLPHEDRNVSSIIVHPEFDENTLFADIAMLRLVSPVVQRAHIDVVCVPDKRKIDLSGACFLTGWGKTTESMFFSLTPNKLKKRLRILIPNHSKTTEPRIKLIPILFVLNFLSFHLNPISSLSAF